MPSLTTSEGLGFRELVFSDPRRYRPDERPARGALFSRCLSDQDMTESGIVLAEQIAVRKGRIRGTHLLRTVVLADAIDYAIFVGGDPSQVAEREGLIPGSTGRSA